ncbi:MAG: hypothetical protein ABI896_03170 [Actinomycetota bacterium]
MHVEFVRPLLHGEARRRSQVWQALLDHDADADAAEDALRKLVTTT